MNNIATAAFKPGDEVQCVDAVGTKRKLLSECYYRIASVEPGGVRLQGYEGNLWAAERFRAVQEQQGQGQKQKQDETASKAVK